MDTRERVRLSLEGRLVSYIDEATSAILAIFAEERAAAEKEYQRKLKLAGEAFDRTLGQIERERYAEKKKLAEKAEAREAALVEKVKQLRVNVEAQADALVVVKRREAKLREALEAITRIDDYEPDCNKSGDFLTARDIARAALATVK